ncbi:MAG TPA: Gfo/Idh/MocA family oxidoreductase [Candidatus Hydrogenedentes bacterium]|nr:Gfo/Idh/MocA family oxidoreductase [Candidatus Hydrogenedentota bacterium]
MSVTRRQFLGRSAAAVLVAGTMTRGKVFGANDRIRVGVVGIHGRGGSHIDGFSGLDDSEVVALCDCDRNVLAARAKQLEERCGKKPKTYVDMRELIADGEIDAVSFATPNHWHTLGTVWACEAGKDVYVEKPLSHEVWEGRQLVAAAKRWNRIVQHGTQRRNAIGEGVEMEPPEHLDWTLWQGPATERPYKDYPNKQGDEGFYVHYNWHWCWHYGNGDIGNQGVHQMDVALWGLDKGFPTRVVSMGGRYGYEDGGETANTQVSTFQYADGTMLVFEVRGRYTNNEAGAMVGNLFYGSEGYMVEDKLYDKNGKQLPDPEEKSLSEVGVDGNHFYSFVKAVQSRNQDDVQGTALDGHLSSAHCHLANISYRIGRELHFDPKTERFVGEGATEGNELLRRACRAGFEVPELA